MGETALINSRLLTPCSLPSSSIYACLFLLTSYLHYLQIFSRYTRRMYSEHPSIDDFKIARAGLVVQVFVCWISKIDTQMITNA